jgi:hypothetical protein
MLSSAYSYTAISVVNPGTKYVTTAGYAYQKTNAAIRAVLAGLNIAMRVRNLLITSTDEHIKSTNTNIRIAEELVASIAIQSKDTTRGRAARTVSIPLGNIFG